MLARGHHEEPMHDSVKGRRRFYPASVLILLFLIGGTGYRAFFSWRTSADRVGEVRAGVDPNVAPWWELALLPRLGPAVAWEVVSHRAKLLEGKVHEACAFESPSDLASVRGIGPKMLLHLGPHLRFDSCSSP